MSLNLPLIDILNQNFIMDLKNLDKQANHSKSSFISDIVNKVKTTEPIVNNFTLITNFINDPKNAEMMQKKQVSPSDERAMHTLVIFTNAYINLNNHIAKLMQDLKNVTINDVIVHIAHARYAEIKPLFSKKEYANDYQASILKLVDEIQASEKAPDINQFEAEINHLVANFMMRVIKNNKLTKEDDYQFALFSISTGICGRLFKELFNIMQQNQHNAENITNNPVSENAKQADNKQSQGKVLTKEIPANGPPADYVKKSKQKTN